MSERCRLGHAIFDLLTLFNTLSYQRISVGNEHFRFGNTVKSQERFAQSLEATRCDSACALIIRFVDHLGTTPDLVSKRGPDVGINPDQFFNPILADHCTREGDAIQNPFHSVVESRRSRPHCFLLPWHVEQVRVISSALGRRIIVYAYAL